MYVINNQEKIYPCTSLIQLNSLQYTKPINNVVWRPTCKEREYITDLYINSSSGIYLCYSTAVKGGNE